MVRMLGLASTLPGFTNDHDPARLPPGNQPAQASLLSAAHAYVDAQGGGEGDYPTAIDGIHVVRSFHDVEANHAVYRPTICVVVQGAKQILVVEETLRYGAMECLIVSMDVPACGRILQASADAPYLGVNIEIDVALMRQVLNQLDKPPIAPTDFKRSLFVAKVEDPLAPLHHAPVAAGADARGDSDAISGGSRRDLLLAVDRSERGVGMPNGLAGFSY